MSDQHTSHDSRQDRPAPKPFVPRYELLERVTAVALALVAVALLWLLAAGAGIDWLRLPSEVWEVVVVLVLFTAALMLVSVLALLESRG